MQRSNGHGINSCFRSSEENKIYQRYYQWISLVFMLQAEIMYRPAYIWRIAEGGVMHTVCVQLDTAFNREKWNDQKRKLVDYFNSQYVGRLHTRYVRHYLIAKVFSCAFMILNIVMINAVIPEFWHRYARAITALLAGEQITWISHSGALFPQSAKCMYKFIGTSGSVQSVYCRWIHWIKNCLSSFGYGILFNCFRPFLFYFTFLNGCACIFCTKNQWKVFHTASSVMLHLKGIWGIS